MKFILVTIAMVSLVACSSTPNTTTTTTTEKTETAAAATPATSTSTDAPAKKTTTTETTTSSDASSFPTITGTEKSAVTCTNKSDTRKISVMTVAEGGCGVVYNKMGADKTVAVAKSMSYCDSVSTKMKTNLEGAGFNCGGEATTGTSSDQ
jgi:cell wall-associated NlpC family hydrolase